MTILEEIDAERRRQIDVEGFSAKHDDRHGNRELLCAALAYLDHARAHGGADVDVSASMYQGFPPPRDWPWDPIWWKPKNPRRDLIRAGALILAQRDVNLRFRRSEDGIFFKFRAVVAEIERLDLAEIETSDE
jgi:hypothetical protein